MSIELAEVLRMARRIGVAQIAHRDEYCPMRTGAETCGRCHFYKGASSGWDCTMIGGGR